MKSFSNQIVDTNEVADLTTKVNAIEAAADLSRENIHKYIYKTARQLSDQIKTVEKRISRLTNWFVAYAAFSLTVITFLVFK